jgi:hypothetical protein
MIVPPKSSLKVQSEWREMNVQISRRKASLIENGELNFLQTGLQHTYDNCEEL